MQVNDHRCAELNCLKVYDIKHGNALQLMSSNHTSQTSFKEPVTSQRKNRSTSLCRNLVTPDAQIKINLFNLPYLSKFHHHMSKDMQKAHNSIPQSAVGQRLLVPSAGALKVNTEAFRRNLTYVRKNTISSSVKCPVSL